MDEEIETLLIGVRADTQGFSRDVDQMRGTLESAMGAGATRAGRSLETVLSRAIRTGKLGFEDLEKVAVGVLDTIAGRALHSGLDALFGGSSGGGGLGSIIGALIGLPGRATGGPVSPNRPYLVGERGPELFVPTSSGTVAAAQSAGPRDVNVAITINASGQDAPRALAQSSRQVARAVKAALAGVD